MKGEVRTVGEGGDLNAMATCIKQASYAHFKTNNDSPRARRNPFVDVMDVLAGRPPVTGADAPRGASAVVESLAQAALKAVAHPGLDLDINVPPASPSDSANRAIVEAVARTSDALRWHRRPWPWRRAPRLRYYGILRPHRSRRCTRRRVAAAFRRRSFRPPGCPGEARLGRLDGDTGPRKPEHLAVFSDALGKVDGVSTWCHQFAQRAAASGKRVWFAACDEADRDFDIEAVPRPFPALARFPLPGYEGIEICVPSLSATVDRLWREGITHVELATPGPMGLVGLAAARIMRLPVTATYHTEFVALVQLLVDDPKLADAAKAYLGWFYRGVDRTFMFSEASRAKLLQLRVPAERISRIAMAVDLR